MTAVFNTLFQISLLFYIHASISGLYWLTLKFTFYVIICMRFAVNTDTVYDMLPSCLLPENPPFPMQNP